MAINLYLVVADDFDGSPHGNDLFVWETTASAAVIAWQKYYDCTEQPVRVGEIPLTQKRGAINWTDVACVWWPTEKAPAP